MAGLPNAPGVHPYLDDDRCQAALRELAPELEQALEQALA